MRTVTFADADLCAWMNRTFVLAWYDIKPEATAAGLGALQPTYSREEIAAYPEGGGGTNVRAVFCSPEGIVRHATQGWWPAGRFREECERGLACAGAKSLDAAKDLRARGADELIKAANELAAANPEEMRRPVRESAVARRVAALRLRATTYAQMEGAIGQEAVIVLGDWEEEAEGRIMK
ncbi:MAG: hypothetical protein FD180_1801 [Planctomycetota bacterium]|nr:MAG: hypothetical protein FD180_1801 [Planctomycetota bacterium]